MDLQATGTHLQICRVYKANPYLCIVVTPNLLFGFYLQPIGSFIWKVISNGQLFELCPNELFHMKSKAE